MSHELFACTVCSKEFKTRSRFNQHLKTHSKPWKCEFCPKGFGLRADLKRHIDSKHRTGHQRFRCEVCERRYVRKDSLAQHKRKHHEEESISVSKPKKLPQDWLLLTSSASNGNLGTLELLIDSGTDLDLRADDGSSAMHCAARTGQIAILQMLLARGADINAKNRKGTSPLYETIIGGHMDCFLLLLHAGADMTGFWSKREEQSNFADYIARAGNCEHMMEFLANVPEDKYSQAVLRLAIASAKFGQVAMLQHLHNVGGTALEELSPVSRQPIPLNVAVYHGQLAAVSFLLPLYGKPEALFRLVKIAAYKGWADICDMLLALQPDINLDDAMYAACQKGRLAVIKILLIYESATTRQSKLSLQKPMLAALWNHHLDSLRYLVSYHAEVLPRAESPDELSRLALVKYLLNLWLQINDMGKDSLRTLSKSGTLLHLAAEHGDLDLARFVLEHEDFSKKKIDETCYTRWPRWPQTRETALDMAQSLGHTEVASLLIAHGATNRNIAPAVQSQKEHNVAQVPFSISNSDLEMQEASNSDTDLEDDEEFDHFTNLSS